MNRSFSLPRKNVRRRQLSESPAVLAEVDPMCAKGGQEKRRPHFGAKICPKKRNWRSQNLTFCRVARSNYACLDGEKFVRGRALKIAMISRFVIFSIILNSPSALTVSVCNVLRWYAHALFTSSSSVRGADESSTMFVGRVRIYLTSAVAQRFSNFLVFFQNFWTRRE